MNCEEAPVDEVICSNELDMTKMSKTERALEILEETLQSEEFMNLQEDFADKHCDLFPPEGDLPPQAMQIYQKYVDMIEKNLLSKVQEVEPNFQFDELIPLIKENKDGEDFAHATVFEFLNAAIDFNEFRSLMASYKAGKGLDLEVTTTKLAD